MNYLYLILGLILLVRGADYLIDGATYLAKRLGIPSLVIGLTVVAMGTSLPEFVINIFSAVKGSTEIAFGNIVGSNIANTLLVLGVVALIRPPKMQKKTVWREIPFSLLAGIVLVLLVNIPVSFYDGGLYLSKVAGSILLVFFILFLYYLYRDTRENRKELIDENVVIKTLSVKRTIFYLVAGVLSLYLGGTWTVNSAISIARGFGASEFLISATVVAFGTSLPELITSFKAAVRDDSDLAVGNIVGSNIINIFFVLGVTALIAPIQILKGVNGDLAFLIGSSVLLFSSLFVGEKHILKRWQGLLFVLLYFSYITYSIIR